MARKIADWRKTLYYVGMFMQISGGLLFGSVFVSFAGMFSDLTGPGAPDHPDFGFMLTRGFGGFGLLILGAIVRGIGARGLAGSGAVLDPEKAREDLEPYSRMTGGMVKDALEEADLNLGGTSEKVVMMKCASCGQLNEENSKFCQECGKGICD